MGADMHWRLTILESTLLASPTFIFLQIHPAGWGPPVLSQNSRHVKGDRCHSRKNYGNAEVSRTGRRGSWGAAKVPGDRRLWQWPSGEFIKDGGLFCGCCLPRDMNVIRAQLKGQSCSVKCHRTLWGSNVPFRGRLTNAVSSLLTHQRSVHNPLLSRRSTDWPEQWCFVHLIVEPYFINTRSASKPWLCSLSPSPSRRLRRCLGWTFHAVSDCYFIAEVTVDAPVEMISLVFWGESHHLCRMSNIAFCCLQDFGYCSSELDPL